MGTDDIRARADRAQARGAMVMRETASAPGAGWVGFAAIMLGLAGTWNVLEGILAIAKSRVYVGDQTFVVSDLKTWGWIVLILGALELVAAFAIASGNQWARWFGIFSACINAIGQLFFLDAYPLWGLAMFAVDVLIVYGLVVYGGRRFEEA
jgi:hypothetical protein